MSTPRRLLLITVILAFCSALISACDKSEKRSVVTEGNFQARVSGTATGQVSGPGLIGYFPPYDANFGSRPAYFFVADDAGVRELGITFTIPANTRPGTYKLVSAHPLDSGKAFEVRVDWSVRNRTVSFYKNTVGSITLQAFPNDGKVAGHRVMGRFNFSTEDKNGREITARGSFDFYGS